MFDNKMVIITFILAVILGCILGEMMRALCDMPPSKESNYNKITRCLGELLYPAYYVGMLLSKFDKKEF